MQGNEETFKFLEGVLTEVAALFPGQYIHIGGDEAYKSEWKKCSKCQARIRKEGLRDEAELQSYFIKRIERILKKQGKRLIGWDEITEGGLAPDATVMYWRSGQAEIPLQAARQGHDVIMSPTEYCYINYYQGDQDMEPPSRHKTLRLKKVYEFDPMPSNFDSTLGKHIIGGQANLWAEQVPTPERAQYMMHPRLAALADAVWSQPENRSWADFADKLPYLMQRYQSAGIPFARSALQVSPDAIYDDETQEFALALNSELGGDIYYTIDGSEPNRHSPHYQKTVNENPGGKRAIRIDTTTTVRARTFSKGVWGQISEERFAFHRAFRKPINYQTPYYRGYSGGGALALTDGRFASKDFRDSLWQGFQQEEAVLTIDLGEEIPIKAIAATFLQNIAGVVFLPVSVEYQLSTDGEKFISAGILDNSISPRHIENLVEEFRLPLQNRSARYVRLIAKNIGSYPQSSLVIRRKPWIFIDEIVVE